MSAFDPTTNGPEMIPRQLAVETLNRWKTVAAKLAFMLTNDEQQAAELLARCIEAERADNR